MEFVLISAGEFDTDSPPNEAGHLDGEGTVHNVKISNAFYMGKYEVTQKQWSDVMGTSFTFWQGDNLPVVLVSWTDVQDFINKLNEKEADEQLVDMNKVYGMPNAFIQQEIQKCWIQNGKASALTGINYEPLYVMYDLRTDEKGNGVMSNCLTPTGEELDEQLSSQSYRRGLTERLYKDQETWDKRSATLRRSGKNQGINGYSKGQL